MKQGESPQKPALIIRWQHIHPSSTKLFRAFATFYYTVYYIPTDLSDVQPDLTCFVCCCDSVAIKSWTNQIHPFGWNAERSCSPMRKCCFVELALMQTHRSAPFKRTLARPHVLGLEKDRAREDWLCNIPGGEKEMTGFCFINTGFMRNMLHMDIRQGAVVLQITSGLKLQWQFPPRITSHRFQLPLRWYASVPLIRYTFMFSATKHLVSQRDAHLSVWETTRPLAAWRNASRASSPQLLVFWQS